MKARGANARGIAVIDEKRRRAISTPWARPVYAASA